jgi:RNA polymerase sigma-54 factor
MLNQSLSQKLLQKLSPQQIQLMKLLQIPTAQLDQRIKEGDGGQSCTRGGQ